MSTSPHPLMPKATAVWLVDNTGLSFEQIAEFCGLHFLEVKGIADGDVAQGVRGKNPVTAGELSRDEISRAEKDPDHRLKLLSSKVKIPEIKAKKRPRYTPVSRRQDRPNAVLWLLRNHAELKDSQIMRLVGTTKPTIGQIRDRSHWNSQNLVPQDPVMLGLCSQVDLDTEVEKAAQRVAKERRAAGLPPLESSETLLPTAETTGYEPPSDGPSAKNEPAPTAEDVFGLATPSAKDEESKADDDEAARVFARLQELKTNNAADASEPEAADAALTTDDEDGAPPVKTGDAVEAVEAIEAIEAIDETPAEAADPHQKHLDALKKYEPEFDEAAARGIIKHLGIALRSKDASLVACSSKEELERVRESWCKKKLALTESDEELDQRIQDVCATMQGDHQKSRVAFYYLLAKNSNKINELT